MFFLASGRTSNVHHRYSLMASVLPMCLARRIALTPRRSRLSSSASVLFHFGVAFSAAEFSAAIFLVFQQQKKRLSHLTFHLIFDCGTVRRRNAASTVSLRYSCPTGIRVHTTLPFPNPLPCYPVFPPAYWALMTEHHMGNEMVF